MDLDPFPASDGSESVLLDKYEHELAVIKSSSRFLTKLLSIYVFLYSCSSCCKVGSGVFDFILLVRNEGRIRRHTFLFSIPPAPVCRLSMIEWTTSPYYYYLVCFCFTDVYISVPSANIRLELRITVVRWVGQLLKANYALRIHYALCTINAPLMHTKWLLLFLSGTFFIFLYLLLRRFFSLLDSRKVWPSPWPASSREYENRKQRQKNGHNKNCFAWAFVGASGTWEWRGGMPPDPPSVGDVQASAGDVMAHSPFLCFLQERFFGEWAGKYFWRGTVKVWPLHGHSLMSSTCKHVRADRREREREREESALRAAGRALGIVRRREKKTDFRTSGPP